MIPRCCTCPSLVSIHGVASCRFLTHRRCLVAQDDVILDTMTVREALTMSALLRLPQVSRLLLPRARQCDGLTLALFFAGTQTMAHQAKLDRVNEIIELLHLTKCRDSVIGSATLKGISGKLLSELLAPAQYRLTAVWLVSAQVASVAA